MILKYKISMKGFSRDPSFFFTYIHPLSLYLSHKNIDYPIFSYILLFPIPIIVPLDPSMWVGSGG